MSRYQPRAVPIGHDPQLSRYIEDELKEVARSKVEPDQFITLDTSYAAPSKIREGMIVLADGTIFDPGSGAGVYCYYAGSWKKLG